MRYDHLAMRAQHLGRALAAFAITLGAGCINYGDPDMAPSASSASSANDDDCDERCDAKAKGCGATQDFADEHCSTFCMGANANDIDCLEAATCLELGHALQTGSDICGEEAPACIAVSSAGCDPLAGITCCDGATCESATGRCCLPANQPALSCTSNGQCCGNATCQVDRNDLSHRFCQ
jgi:hypothetical protein